MNEADGHVLQVVACLTASAAACTSMACTTIAVPLLRRTGRLTTSSARRTTSVLLQRQAAPPNAAVLLLYCPVCPLAEQYIQDEVSGVSEQRRGVAAALIIFALLTLIPMAPDVITDMGSVGSPGNFI